MKKRIPSLFGLLIVCEERQLLLYRANRLNGSVTLSAPAVVEAAKSVLADDPVVLGQKVRGKLAALGGSDRRAVVVWPSHWLLSQSTSGPVLTGEDLESWLAMEAEQRFPIPPDELVLTRSVCTAGATLRVTQFAVRREQLLQLEEVLATARIKPVEFNAGVFALKDVFASDGVGRVTLIAGDQSTTLIVSADGGIACFRQVSGALADREGAVNEAGIRTLVRELAISLEQIPLEFRNEVKEITCVATQPKLLVALEAVLKPWAEARAMSLNPPVVPANELGRHIAEAVVHQGLAEKPVIAFKPQRQSRWASWKRQLTTKRLASTGFAAAALALAIAAAYAWQQYELWQLRAEWSRMATPVGALKGIQANIREYRPWYDTSALELRIMRRIAECFPETGSVTAKSVEFRGGSAVTINGSASDNRALLQTLEQLRTTKEISGLKVEQIRGKTPEQFTVSFVWGGTRT